MSHATPSGRLRLVLASASPRRRELLHRAGLDHTVAPANVAEHEDPGSCPRTSVMHNAEIKARAVAKKFSSSLVLSADTVVAIDRETLNKPADLTAARAMLRKLSGRTHTVYTGMCLKIAEENFEETHVLTCDVTFRTLDDDAITRYFAIVNPLDKAGAYGIQTGKGVIIARHDEPLSNIMGLPVEFLLARLEFCGLAARLG